MCLGPTLHGGVYSKYTLYRWLYGYVLEATNVITNVMKGRLKKWTTTFIFLFSLRIEQTMAHQQTQDNPDPKNIIPDNTKWKRNATDCAQGLDSYFKTVEATTKPWQVQQQWPERQTIPTTKMQWCTGQWGTRTHSCKWWGGDHKWDGVWLWTGTQPIMTKKSEIILNEAPY